jgi:prepilin-type N-terminal cleavage/methylation domain-containing protein
MLVNLTIYWFTSESLVMKKVKKQSGFTLVEIAIVLVVIGLLLGGVLKGQELIESSKIKSMAKDLNGFSALITTYQDRYRSLPGDDSLTEDTYNERGWIGEFAASATPGDSLIGTAATTATVPFSTAGEVGSAVGENLLAIQALRSAGFLQGDGSKATLPKNAAGGLINFTHTIMGFGAQNVVCFSKLSGKQAGALDRLLDDGVSGTGSIRSDTVAVAEISAATAVYSEATKGVFLCKTL